MEVQAEETAIGEGEDQPGKVSGLEKKSRRSRKSSQDTNCTPNN